MSRHLHRVDPNKPIIDFRFIFKIRRALLAFHEIHHHSRDNLRIMEKEQNCKGPMIRYLSPLLYVETLEIANVISEYERH